MDERLGIGALAYPFLEHANGLACPSGHHHGRLRPAGHHGDHPRPVLLPDRSRWALIALAPAVSGHSSPFWHSASPATGLGIASTGVVLAVSLTLAVRVLAALERTRSMTRRTFARARKEFWAAQDH